MREQQNGITEYPVKATIRGLKRKVSAQELAICTLCLLNSKGSVARMLDVSVGYVEASWAKGKRRFPALAEARRTMRARRRDWFCSYA